MKPSLMMCGLKNKSYMVYIMVYHELSNGRSQFTWSCPPAVSGKFTVFTRTVRTQCYQVYTHVITTERSDWFSPECSPILSCRTVLGMWGMLTCLTDESKSTDMVAISSQCCKEAASLRITEHNGDVTYLLIRWRRHHVRESQPGPKYTIHFRSIGADWSYILVLYKFSFNALFYFSIKCTQK